MLNTNFTEDELLESAQKVGLFNLEDRHCVLNFVADSFINKNNETINYAFFEVISETQKKALESAGLLNLAEKIKVKIKNYSPEDYEILKEFEGRTIEIKNPKVEFKKNRYGKIIGLQFYLEKGVLK